MIKAKAYAAHAPKAPLSPFSLERREPGPNDVVIDIKFSGICHSDIHQAREEWGAAKFPMVPGHEIAGIVVKVGSAVKGHNVGDPVGVGCMVDSCRHCAPCQQELQQFCENGTTWTYNSVDKKTNQVTMGGYSDSRL